MALIGIAADKGAPGVTTSAVVLAAVWPRPVLLAECDPAGGDLGYWLPAAEGGRLDPHRGLLSMAVATRRGAQPHQVWEHTQKVRGGLDVLTGVTTAEQGAGLEPLWGSVGLTLSRLPQADVIADCGRIGSDGPQYDLLTHASSIVLITRDSLGEMVRLRERIAALTAGLARRDRAGIPVGVVVIAGRDRFHAALVDVGKALGRDGADVIGGLAYEPASAGQLHGEWGGKLDRSLLVRTARAIAGQLAGALPAVPPPSLPPVTLPTAAVPPTAVPPRAVPPTAVPPTAVPLRAAPPSGTRDGRHGPTARHRVNGAPRADAPLHAPASPGANAQLPAPGSPGADAPPRADAPPATGSQLPGDGSPGTNAPQPARPTPRADVPLADIPQPTTPGGV